MNKADEWSITCIDNPDNTANRVADFFKSAGYKLESGTPQEGLYGTGSNMMRIFFGAFAKRFVFRVIIAPDATGSRIAVEKGISGAMGGAIGYAKMKKELNRIREGLQSHLR